MEITTFNCRNCGANIPLPDSAGTVACTYCGSSHRVSFQDGAVIAELTEKVKRLDEDVARLKGGRVSPNRAPGPAERLAMIGEGKRDFHEYFASVKAGRSADSPEVLALFDRAQANLVGGYGPVSVPLIGDAYGAKLLGVDPPAGYTCLYMLLGVIVLSLALGGFAFFEWELKYAVILLGIGLAGIVGGIPFVLLGIRVDRATIARRKEALKQLDELEAEIRRELAAQKDKNT